ncbi:pupal cuticle protein G1A-like [Cylas formicarius]|uniref:pupal cuticle protein G1A-like n=1 Tax=Cylas formicarius TaxID=197179 RepID=UPI0029586391|nr:pupal cuticle protein G1A-like [Cylas formicarius]
MSSHKIVVLLLVVFSSALESSVIPTAVHALPAAHAHLHAAPYAHLHTAPHAHLHAAPYAQLHAAPHAHLHAAPHAHLHAVPAVPAVHAVPAVRYTQVAPPSVLPFSAQVSTFARNLHVFDAPYAAGVLPGTPAIVQRAVLPAGPVFPAPAPFVHQHALTPVVSKVAPLVPAPLAPLVPAPLAHPVPVGYAPSLHSAPLWR